MASDDLGPLDYTLEQLQIYESCLVSTFIHGLASRDKLWLALNTFFRNATLHKSRMAKTRWES